jgi:uncharacterized membrane protein
MEIVLLVVVIVMIFWVANRVSDKSKLLHYRMDEVLHELQQLRSEVESARSAPAAPQQSNSVIQEDVTPPVIVPVPEPVIAKEEVTADISFQELIEQATLQNASVPAPPEQPVATEPQPSFLENFLRNNPDLEKFIGENLMNKIGIGILVLGIGYFVKFAIDKEWINEIGRVFIGILAGGALIGLAHRMRKSFAAFSSVLVGGGLAVLYFTIAIAFHQYQIFSQTVAFVLMVVITGFSILLSVSYNRVELAVLAILGGFATPFMLSTGEGNYKVLFTYVLILNVGMLVLAYLKKWNILNWICYVFTIILYGGWLTREAMSTKEVPYVGALVFGTLFYLVFFLMNIINNIKEKSKFASSEIAILLSNTFLYYSAGMFILANIEKGLYQGLFTVLVAVFNFLFAFVLYKNEKVDRNLIYLLIGLVITFVSLAVPVQLEGNYITMFWALEAVLLLWLSQKSGLKLIANSSLLVNGLMLVSLAMDWSDLYTSTTINTVLPVLLNKAFITGVVAVISLLATQYLLRLQEHTFYFRLFAIPVRPYEALLSIILGLVIYLVGLLELNYQLTLYIEPEGNRTILLGCYNLLYISILLLIGFYREKYTLSVAASILGVLGTILYLLVYNQAVLQLVKSHYINSGVNFIGFGFHYLSFLLILGIVALLFRNKNLLSQIVPSVDKGLSWFLCFVLVFVFSSELVFHVVYFNSSSVTLTGLSQESTRQIYEQFTSLLKQIYKVGFPILWGICGFAFMIIGLRRKNRNLRIIALSLFTLTLAKLFIYDIRGISEGGKIAAFISLGIVLLVISFMYQNLKRLILADDSTNQRPVE